MALDVVVDEGAERENRQAPLSRVVQGEGDQLAAEPPSLELFIDLGMDQLDQFGTQPVLQESRPPAVDANNIALAISVIGDCDLHGAILAEFSVSAALASNTAELHLLEMPSKHPRIAVTADPELGDALARVRAATGTREADATLLRRLAVEGAEAEIEAARDRRAAAEAMFEAMGGEQFDLDLEAVDRLNAPPAA